MWFSDFPNFPGYITCLCLLFFLQPIYVSNKQFVTSSQIISLHISLYMFYLPMRLSLIFLYI